MNGARCACVVALVLAALLAPRAAAQPRQQPPGGSISVAEAGALVAQYCVGCHNQRTRAGDLTLDTIDLAQAAAHAETLEKVVLKLRAGMMPPPGMPRPSVAARDAMVSWLETTLDRAAASHPNPGRPALHRLNRAEYANAVRDLLALEVDPAALLPPDDSSDGFDNNADVLGVSPALLERYVSAARTIAALALGSGRVGPGTTVYRAPPDESQTQHREGLPLGTRGGLVVRHNFPADGEYTIKVKLLETALGTIRGLEHANQVEVLIDDERIHIAEVGGTEDFVGSAVNSTDVLNSIGARLSVRVQVAAGPRAVASAFLHGRAARGGNRLQSFLRSNVDTTDHTGVPHVESITIAGPFNATGAGRTPSRDRILICRPTKPAEEAPCARNVVSTLARRAYRRPVSDAEVERLLAFFEAGRRDGVFDDGIERALRAILASPKFIVRVERDSTAAEGTVSPISDLELASRLSFFLWSSGPDDELLNLASRGRLRAPGVLERQVRRMLAEPRADALVRNFAGQWLQLRNLRASLPDQNDFPNFDDNLRQAFRRETEMLFESLIREDRSVLDLLTADFTFVNERLARHYGIPYVYGSHFRRVAVRDEARRGLLGHGSMLLVTSHPDRTSPVLRGKWILDNLLGTPPPPPPNNVPALEESQGSVPRTVREQMEVHRRSPACASCHRLMDPLGLALENFDAVGTWRDRDAGSPIDASVELADGTPVDGAVALRQALLKRSDLLVETFVQKMLTYALGRGLEYYDRPVVRAVARGAAGDNYRFSSIVTRIVMSMPFQMTMNAPRESRTTSAAP